MLPPKVVMNLFPEIRDCLGHFHNHSPSKRNSPFERLWHVIGQADYTIRKLLIKSPELLAIELNESNSGL
jgi:hypothetical protein